MAGCQGARRMGEWGDKERGARGRGGGSETKAGEQVSACASHCVGPLSAESGVFLHVVHLCTPVCLQLCLHLRA